MILKWFCKFALLLIASFLLLILSLFIPKPLVFPEKTVDLGYPLGFFTLEMSGNKGSTHLSGAPDEYLGSRKFNLLSVWEEYAEFSISDFIGSLMIVFLALLFILLFVNTIKTLNKA